MARGRRPFESGSGLGVPRPGAEVIIAVDLNGDLLGRRVRKCRPDRSAPRPCIRASPSSSSMCAEPAAGGAARAGHADRSAPAAAGDPSAPGYFDVPRQFHRVVVRTTSPAPALGGPAAARDARAATARHRIVGVRPDQGGDRRRTRECRTGAADAAPVSVPGKPSA